MKPIPFILILILFVVMNESLRAQGFLHTDGKQIVDGNGENFIIRGIGTGNWMIQEGYMMQTAGIAGTQHEFRQKLEEAIGKARTDSFYTSWLNNHFRKIDVDSLAAWGFNTIRVAMHYKWFTPPIEEEPAPGQITWINTGFDMLDSLLSWCSMNKMYLILDMHGAPGGQGSNADISDYDESKPSLWESNYNKDKLVALWYKLAERYSNEKWIGGYDLINETNWNFPEGNNSPLLNIYKRITDTIRLADQNHIIFIEGNWWANDFSGLTPPWDDNMVYSFHKYWSYNNDNSLDWVIQLREKYNIPLWLGETGENSNTWFTNLVRLAESKNIGWSWWPVKKAGINNPLKVDVNSDYQRLISYWKGEADFPGLEKAYQGVLGFSQNHRLENCRVQKDVIDAIFRQPYTDEIKAYKVYGPEEEIPAVDYALGRNGFAYFDTDTGDYHVDTGEYTSWNIGRTYRNDGVDIEKCTDNEGIGYSVGWTKDGEWMLYTLKTDSASSYDLLIRSASESESYIRLEANGAVISELIYLPPTGSWSAWRSTIVHDIILPAGELQLKVKFIKGGANLNFFKFMNPQSIENIPFRALYAETSRLTNEVYLHLNKAAGYREINAADFELSVDDRLISAVSAEIDEDNLQRIKMDPSEILNGSQNIELSYTGTSIVSQQQDLKPITRMNVENKLADFHIIPGGFEAEAFIHNNGFRLEDCLDEGGGLNTAYANPGDYLDYLVYVPEPGFYQLSLRVASERNDARIGLYYQKDDAFVLIKSIGLPQTGGWQNWVSQATSLTLPEGKYLFRVMVEQGEHNLNRMDFTIISGRSKTAVKKAISLYPNPADDYFTVKFPAPDDTRHLELVDLHGVVVFQSSAYSDNMHISTFGLKPGTYFLVIRQPSEITTHKLMIN